MKLEIEFKDKTFSVTINGVTITANSLSKLIQKVDGNLPILDTFDEGTVL